MFMPKCPQCGGKARSAEPNTAMSKHAANGWLGAQAAAGHPHPYMKLGVMAISLGREVYKRMPGGGRKACTHCGHEFR